MKAQICDIYDNPEKSYSFSGEIFDIVTLIRSVLFGIIIMGWQGVNGVKAYLLQVKHGRREALDAVHCPLWVRRPLALHHHILVEVQLPPDSWVL